MGKSHGTRSLVNLWRWRIRILAHEIMDVALGSGVCVTSGDCYAGLESVTRRWRWICGRVDCGWNFLDSNNCFVASEGAIQQLGDEWLLVNF